MKYTITGHTSGIGEALYNKLSPNAIGFSRRTGFDINDKKNRTSIIIRSADSDVFINNAEDGFGQTKILLDYWEEYRNTNKTIICVGSKIAELDNIDSRPELIDYFTYKKTLKQTVNNLSRLNYPLQIKYVWFGYVNTQRTLTKYPHFTDSDYITIDTAVDKILDGIL